MTQLDRQGPSDPVFVPFTPGMRDNPGELAAIPDEIARAHELPADADPDRGVHRAVAQRVVQLLLLRPQVLPRGLPGDAGDPQRVVDADRVPRQRRGDGEGRARRSRTSPPTTSTAPSAAPASCAAPTRCSPATSTGSAPAPWTWSRRCARSPSSSGVHQPAWQTWNERTNERTHEPVLGETPVSQEHVRDWADGLDLADRRRDRAVRRLRGRVLPHLRPARRRPDPAAGRLRVRADGRAVVLRRAGRGDGVRRPGQAVRPAQPRQLALHRHQAGARARPARLHHLHRGLPEVLRRRLRHRGRPRRRAVRRADPGGQADPVGADRAGDHLPRPLPAQQAQGHLEGAARDPARDPRSDLHRRRPGDAVVLLLRRRRRAAGREARAHRGDLGRPARQGGGAGGRHPGQRVPLVRAAARRGGRGRGHRRRRHPRAAGRVARHHGRRVPHGGSEGSPS